VNEKQIRAIKILICYLITKHLGHQHYKKVYVNYFIICLLQVRLADEDFSWIRAETLLITSVNLTFTTSLYHKETCASCMHGFAIWVCAEDLNPKWWSQQRASAASYNVNFPRLLFLLATCIYATIMTTF